MTRNFVVDIVDRIMRARDVTVESNMLPHQKQLIPKICPPDQLPPLPILSKLGNQILQQHYHRRSLSQNLRYKGANHQVPIQTGEHQNFRALASQGLRAIHRFVHCTSLLATPPLWLAQGTTTFS